MHHSSWHEVVPHLKRKRNPIGPNRRPMPRVLGVPRGGGRFLMSEVRLNTETILAGWWADVVDPGVLPPADGKPYILNHKS